MSIASDKEHSTGAASGKALARKTADNPSRTSALLSVEFLKGMAAISSGTSCGDTEGQRINRGSSESEAFQKQLYNKETEEGCSCNHRKPDSLTLLH